MAATLAVGAMHFDWAPITGGGISSVDKDRFALTPRMQRKFLPLGAYMQILQLVIVKVLGWIEPTALAEIRGRQIGLNALLG